MRLLLPACLALSVCLSSAGAAPAKAPSSKVAAAAKASPAKLSAAAAFSRSATLPKWADALERVPETQSGEPVVVRLAEVHYWAGDNPAYLVNRAVQVNSSSRLSEIGQFSIDFMPAYQKVILHRIAILRGKEVLDRTQSANVRVLDNEPDAEKGYYLGAASAKVLLEDVKPGDTLWLTYTVEGRNPVFGSTWAETLPWTKPDPVELRKMVVAYPSIRTLRWRVSGLPRASLTAPVTEQRGAITRVTFKEQALAADEPERSLPPNYIPVPVVDVTEYKDWAQVTRWALSLFPNASGDPDMQALVRRFDGKTDEERASKALHWVQDEIRYFSVSMGDNSHRPQPPEVVLKRRFGDCKDKTQLLVALYRAMGLQAQPVLLNATSPQYPAQMLPSPTSFTHAIVRVVLDGKPYFVDPTRQNERGRIPQLPGVVPGATALVVDAATSGLLTLPEESIEVPLEERTDRITISALHGNAQLNVRTEYRGRLAAPMRDAYHALGSYDVKKLLLAEVERTYPGIKLDSAPILSDTPDGMRFVVEAQFTASQPLKDEDGHFTLPMRTHVMEGTLGIPDKLVRKHPLWLSAGHYRARYHLDVSLPSEARLVQQDDRFAVDTKFLTARAQLTWRGAHLDYYLDYAITAPEVAPADLPNLSEQVQKLNPLFENKLEFTPVAIAPQTAKEASLRVLDILSKMSAYEDLQDDALRTGKMPEVKLDDATYAKLNYRALCDSISDKVTVLNWNPILAAPLAALDKIVNAKADKRSKQLCDARLQYILHSLPDASKRLAKLQPSDDDRLTLMQAWADFHAGERERSKTNLARYLKARKATGDLNARDAAAGFALAHRLGLGEPAEVREVADSLQPDAWPMPLFRLLRGQLNAEDLLKQVDRLPPAEREYAALDAHFFISQAYLAADEPRKADLYVNWLLRYALLGSDFEVLAYADRFGQAEADADVQQAQQLESKRGSTNDAAQHWKAASARGLGFAEAQLGQRYIEGDGVKQDTEKGIALLESAAAKGFSGAMNDLANVYADAKGVPRDDQRAVAYYRQAVENGNPVAAYNLGRAYWLGEHGQQIDFDKAFILFRDASEMAYVDAQFFLSRHYFDGKGTEKNDVLARFWATQAAMHKDLDGTAQLGRVLLLSENDKDIRQAGLRLLEYAAARGNSFAQLEYGRVLLDGMGVEPNAKAAFRMIEAASEGGSDRAAALLGRMYVEGLGVTADREKGLKLLTAQEKAGLPDAFYNLGQVYRSATAGMTDKAKAADYFRRGAEKGQQDAAEMLALMLHTGEGIARDLPQAAHYYELAIRAGKPRAMNNLAAMYEHGQGVPQDMRRAMDLYRQGARLGSLPAVMNLAELYEGGADKSASPFVALAYYMLADRFGVQDASAAVQRLKTSADPATMARAQKYAASWKPGKAMPEES